MRSMRLIEAARKGRPCKSVSCPTVVGDGADDTEQRKGEFA
jgi:hypothetical protein